MTTLTLTGLRGGVGVTSLLAALGHILHSHGERVLLVDLCPENLLRLHFNVAFTATQGWARAELERRPWSEDAFEISSGLYLMPYGDLDGTEVLRLERALQNAPRRWARRCVALEHHYDWILFDVPRRLPGHVGSLQQGQRGNLLIEVLEADAACHALLRQRGELGADLLVVNRFDPASQLQRDLLLVWQHTHGEHPAHQLVHRDEAMQEALASKAPVGHYAPHSQATSDLRSLATWCLARRRSA